MNNTLRDEFSALVNCMFILRDGMRSLEREYANGDLAEKLLSQMVREMNSKLLDIYRQAVIVDGLLNNEAEDEADSLRGSLRS